jgi:hypothetical protein
MTPLASFGYNATPFNLGRKSAAVSGETLPASMKSASADSLIRTCRPTLTNSIRLRDLLGWLAGIRLRHRRRARREDRPAHQPEPPLRPGRRTRVPVEHRPPGRDSRAASTTTR